MVFSSENDLVEAFCKAVENDRIKKEREILAVKIKTVQSVPTAALRDDDQMVLDRQHADVDCFRLRLGTTLLLP